MASSCWCPVTQGWWLGWAGRWQLRFLGVSVGDKVLAGGISLTLPYHPFPFTPDGSGTLEQGGSFRSRGRSLKSQAVSSPSPEHF